MQLREIILDTETTGLDPNNGDRVVEIGAIEMVNKVLTGEVFHCYINPERDMPAVAYRIHGISGAFLKDKPIFRNVATDFLKFIKNSKLVIHNAKFDLKFLNHELSIAGYDFVIPGAIDTVLMAKKKFPGMRVNLDALCKRFKIDNSARKLHGALKDAALLAEVYIELSGGRQVVFDIQSKTKPSSKVIYNLNKNNTKYIVVKPTTQEIKKHKEFLEKFLNLGLGREITN